MAPKLGRFDVLKVAGATPTTQTECGLSVHPRDYLKALAEVLPERRQAFCSADRPRRGI